MREPYKPVELLWVQIFALIVTSSLILESVLLLCSCLRQLVQFDGNLDGFLWVLFPFVSDRTEKETTERIVPIVLERLCAKYRLFWCNPNIRTNLSSSYVVADKHEILHHFESEQVWMTTWLRSGAFAMAEHHVWLLAFLGMSCRHLQ